MDTWMCIDRKPPLPYTIINAAINHHLVQEIAPPPPPSTTHSLTNTTTVEAHLPETLTVEATAFINDIQKMWLLFFSKKIATQHLYRHLGIQTCNVCNFHDQMDEN